MSSYIIVKIQAECHARLDRYLKSLYPLLTQGKIQEAIRKGMVRLNDKRCLAKSKIQNEDAIKIPMHFKDYIKVTDKNYSPDVANLADKVLNSYKLYEDDNLLVINKPSNLATQGGSKVLISLDCALKYLNNKNGCSLRLVHRLDKETSGVMLISKTLTSAILIAKAFQERAIKKEYVSLNYISDASSLTSFTHSFSDESGKVSITNYSVIEKIMPDVAKMLWKPITGRKHQIRQHAQLINCPIIGDKKYYIDGMPKFNAKHFFLHSAKIILPEGLLNNAQKLEFEAQLPHYFKDFAAREKKGLNYNNL